MPPLSALPPKNSEKPRSPAALAAFNLFHDAHVTSAPTMNKQAALSSYRAQTAYLNRSIAELEGKGSAPAAPAKAATTKKTVTTKAATTGKGRKAAAKTISA